MDPGAAVICRRNISFATVEPFSLELVRLPALLWLGIPGNAVSSAAAATFCLEGFVYSTHQNHRFPPHVTAFILVEHLIFCWVQFQCFLISRLNPFVTCNGIVIYSASSWYHFRFRGIRQSSRKYLPVLPSTARLCNGWGWWYEVSLLAVRKARTPYTVGTE
jgi:hypothetical protein